MRVAGRVITAVMGALVITASFTAGYTVDCNHEYTDCEAELSKLTDEDENQSSTSVSTTLIESPITVTSTHKPKIKENKNLSENFSETESNLKPKARLLSMNIDDIQNIANALHNHSLDKINKKSIEDISDINFDSEDTDDSSKYLSGRLKHDKHIPNKFYSNLQAPFRPKDIGISEILGTCKESGITYKVGDKIERGCDETCECSSGGSFECSPRCKHPYIRRDRRIEDPLCFESPVDECCSIIACASGNGESKMSKVEVCKYGNETHRVGEKWFVGCEQACTCEINSVVTCKPRCKALPPSDKCINVQDPSDSCCELQVCDVSHDAHEIMHDHSTSSTTNSTASSTTTTQEPIRNLFSFVDSSNETSKTTEAIGSIKVLQNNSVQVNLMRMNDSKDPIHLLLSSDGGKTFEDIELKYSNLILNLEGGKEYTLKTRETGTKFNFTITATDIVDIDRNKSKVGCLHDGKFYEVGEEFHIGCSELCECTGDGQKECAALECPSHVGLELLARGCVRWAPGPTPHPPNCCPRAARCLSDGTCHYKDTAIPNWTEVPISLTGCEQRCFCENGELDCQEICTPLSPLPPQNLRCPPHHRPAPVNISDEDCCKKWGCLSNGHASTDFPTNPDTPHNPPFLPTIPPEIHFPQDEIPDYDQNNIHRPINSLGPSIPGLPPGLHIPSSRGEENKKLTVISLQADSPTSVKMLFGLPPLLVGLRGSVDLRYTDKEDEDITHWYSQVFAPAEEVLTTSRLEFRLTGLIPSTTYKIRGKLYLHNLPVEPESEIYTVRTQDLPTVPPVEQKRREIDSKLTVVNVNDTSARVAWRHFSDDELQFIDGIQVRYRTIGTPIYSMTEVLHHGRTVVTLRDLRPATRYEASLVLVPPPRSRTELADPATLEFTTAPYIDPYNWSVVVEARVVGSEAAEIAWSGVPAPAERWVRVYRAAHACGDQGGQTRVHSVTHTGVHSVTHPGVQLTGAQLGASARREHDVFKLAARDQPPAITLTGLHPNSRCRVWLELFLTNGKVKTSNVLEINTKSLDEPEPIDNAIEASSVSGSAVGRGDYYGALVGVGVVAALGALTSLLLLLVVIRRHRPRSVPITPVPTAPRESSLPPYDNPAYKLELQQETMDL